MAKLDDLKLDDPQEREAIVDQLTQELMKSLLVDCVEELPSRTGKGSTKEKSEEGTSSSGIGQQNHDVYYIDQLQSEKEERKEWIEIRQRHLIENDLIRIDQYVNEIVDALL